MVVARKEFQNYEYKEEKIKKPQRNKKPKKNNTLIKLKLFLYASGLLTIAIVVLLRFAHISKLQYDFSSLQTEVTNLEKEKQNITINLERVKDSRWIEEVAISSLNMNYPSENQKVYIDVNEGSTIALANTTEENLQNTAENNNLIGKIINNIVN
ncbi:cell division protein FtsL [Clostridium sp. D2Q-11]|uniref:Cell division protein FtsL n=1 Tax=Anaeromonas frigoriresistens TaxID=2683708 RepID=A0A942V577_9FIRM|nr:cell division protein FtsL [Anaeromonas frigoriresistens]MBS4540092.1 cell division protein FtsL [Anaeromonas frigoriresistens]